MEPGRGLIGLLFALWLLIGSIPAGAQSDGGAAQSLSPPRDATGAAYLDSVKHDGLQSDIAYKRSDPTFDGQDESRLGDDLFNTTPLGKTVGWAILGLLLIVFVGIAYRSRGQLVDLVGPPRRRAASVASSSASIEEPAIDHDLIEHLRALPDPRQGLRTVLQRFLALAAEENDVPLRRSLTTREIIRRLPGGWAHRAELETLASEVERVVFGGRAIENTRYQHCLDLAAPFLRRTKA